jgi:hypothetical protein
MTLMLAAALPALICGGQFDVSDFIIVPLWVLWIPLCRASTGLPVIVREVGGTAMAVSGRIGFEQVYATCYQFTHFGYNTCWAAIVMRRGDGRLTIPAVLALVVFLYPFGRLPSRMCRNA